jgi:hypothetical protein
MVWSSAEKKLFEDLALKVGLLEDENRALKDQVKDLLEFKTLANSRSTATPSAISVNSSTVAIPIVTSITREESEKKKREKNIIIFGMNVSIDGSSDSDSVNLLFDNIGADKSKIKNILRLKQSSNGSIAPPVIVELCEVNDKFAILKAAYSNKTKINNIFVNLDLTKMEQAKAKELRIQRKSLNDLITDKSSSDHYFGIRGDLVVKIMK